MATPSERANSVKKALHKPSGTRQEKRAKKTGVDGTTHVTVAQVTLSRARQVRRVVAAGAVVTRAGGDEVLLVHRPKYDDWSFPKGKVDPGEQVPAAALREVAEETGLRIRLGLPLSTQEYPVRAGTKEVRYWTGRVLGADDVAGYARAGEIDEVRWVGTDKARRLLTYPHDRDTLDEALAQPRRVHTVVVLRHAEATGRKQWQARAGAQADDTRRPLAPEGERQAQALTAMLQAWHLQRVVCSTSLRCVQTVEPWQRSLAAAGEAPHVEFPPALSEELATEAGVNAVVAQALTSGESTLLCTHRPVLGAVLSALGVPDVRLAPGEALVVHHRKGRLLASELVPAPML